MKERFVYIDKGYTIEKVKLKCKELEPCQCCERWDYLQEHHVYGGSGRRSVSDKHGMVINLCPACHREVHLKPNQGLDKKLKEEFQRLFEEDSDRETFISLFGRNYLD